MPGMDANPVVLFLLGLLGGFTAGLLGIGGGVILVPLLAYVGGLSFHMATAVSLVQVFFAAVSGVSRHFRLGNVSLRTAIIMGLGSSFAATIASATAPSIPAHWLQIGFLILVTVSGALLMVPKKESTATGVPSASPFALVGLGLVAGTMAGLLGAGGGFIMVPMMIYALGFRTKLAIGTSLATVLIGSFSGVAVKFATGQIEVLLAGVVVAGGLIGAQFGAWACNRASPVLLRRILSGILFLVGLRTLLELLGVI